MGESEAGINMVDLMMWLVIAALMLAAAIQGIGFYQKAAYLYDMQTEINGVAANAHAAASMNGGYISDALLTTVVAESNAANPNDKITITFGQVKAYASGPSDNGYGFSLMSSVTEVSGGAPGSYFLKAANPLVESKYAVYFFDPTATFLTGVSTVDKDKLDAAEAGTTPTPEPEPTPTATATPTPTTPPVAPVTPINTTGMTLKDIAISDDGSKLFGGGDVASTGNGGYVSTDGGATWVKTLPTGSNLTWSVSSSADGKYVIAGASTQFLRYSHDGGTTWQYGLGGAANSLINTAVSPSGTHMAVAEQVGYVWTSANNGTTFIKRTSSGYRRWKSVTISPDGSRIVGTSENPDEGIYVSDDFGVTWSSKSVALAALAAGTPYAASGNAGTSTYVAGKDGGALYVSNNGGVSWTAKTELGAGIWRNLVASGDGTKLAVAKDNGALYTSTDSGATWKEQTAAGTGVWKTIRITAGDSGFIGVRDASIVRGNL